MDIEMPADETIFRRTLLCLTTKLGLGPRCFLPELVTVRADWTAHWSSRSGSTVEGKHFNGQNPAAMIAFLAFDAPAQEVRFHLPQLVQRIVRCMSHLLQVLFAIIEWFFIPVVDHVTLSAWASVHLLPHKV